MSCFCAYINIHFLIEGFCKVMDQGISDRYEDPPEILK